MLQLGADAELTSEIDDSIPDLSITAAVSAQGSIFTTSAPSSLGRVLVWDSLGGYGGQYGRRGEGPGEFAGGGELILKSGPGDSLFVLDDLNRWSVLSEDLAFSRMFSGRYSGRMASAMHILPNGGVLTTGKVLSGRTGKAFHVIDGQGELMGAFGEFTEELDKSQMGGRSSALSSDSTFWVAPPDGTRGGIQIEEWTLSGRLLRTQRRVPPWLPRRPYENGGPDEPDMPAFRSLTVDEDGLLWMLVYVRDPDWHPPRPQREDAETPGRGDDDDAPPSIAEQYDGFLEVIDPAGERVLASVRFDDPFPAGMPFTDQFSGSRRFYRVAPDSLGFNSISVFRVGLVLRSD